MTRDAARPPRRPRPPRIREIQLSLLDVLDAPGPCPRCGAAGGDPNHWLTCPGDALDGRRA